MAWVEGAALGSGLALGTASVLSVGPNNLMMIREGLRRGRVRLVGLLTWSSYLALLVLASVLTKPIADGLAPIRLGLSWLGIAALAWFATGSLRSAFRTQAGPSTGQSTQETWAVCVRRVMTVIWLNPLTYVELLLIPAAMCGSFQTSETRFQFMLGLFFMTTACCSGYSLGGGLCAALLRHRRTLQMFDLASGLILAAVAMTMTAGLASGFPLGRCAAGAFRCPIWP